MRGRGVTAAEVEQVIEHGSPVAVNLGRLGRALVFDYRQEWNGRFKQQKRVKDVEEDGEAIVVTVLSYYGEWD